MTRPLTRLPPARALWLAALFAALTGLFGMHGLDTHGTDQMEAGTSLRGHPLTHLPADTIRLVATAEDVPMGGIGGMGGMGAMCVAVLLAGLALLLVARAATRCALGVSRPLSMSVPIPARGRDPDPPSLLTLSVARC
ncbi:MAG: DUF6153 family protein [Nocardioidaceae bacterium]